MAKPKLALIPAAQGSKFYSVLPSDGVGDFDFARASAATRINKYGLIETVTSGQSRLNYPLIDGVVKGCPHHILEPARSNLIQYSEDFSQGYWTKSGASVVSGFVSPKGDLSAFKLVASATTGQHVLTTTNYVSSVNNNSPYSISIFVKAGEYSKIGIRESRNNGSYCTYNLSTGSLIEEAGTNGLSKIESFLNGWYKITLPYTTLSFSQSLPQIFALNDNYVSGNPNNYSYTGDGTSGVYIWGAQLEAGSYPTSYIVSNSGSATTRVAETAKNAGDASTFNDSEGVLMVEISALVNDSDTKRISLSDGTTSNRLSIYLSDNSVGLVQVAAGSVNINTNLTGYDATLNSKIIAKYKQNDFSLWINGYKILTDTSGNAYGDGVLDTLNFNNGYSGNDFYGNTKQIQYFDSALSDTELETLTSWVSFQDMAEGQLYTIE